MAKSVSARRQGDEFQALFFWKQLVNLLIDDNPVERVTFESDERIFVDDIVVEYREPVVDQFTGDRHKIDAFQCKYHVAQNASFAIDKIIDPEFLGNQQSMLQRLFEAYQKYAERGEQPQLHIVSSAVWDPRDPFSRFLASENHVRADFFQGGPRSTQAKLRAVLADHLRISERGLRGFLRLVRFELGINRKQLAETLAARLKQAGLQPFHSTITDTRYAELPWKWLEQDRHVFDRTSLAEAVRQEKLVDTGRKRLLLIRHQSLNPIAPFAVRANLPGDLRGILCDEVPIDLTYLFRDGRLMDPRLAVDQQAIRINEIAGLWNDQPNLEIGYYGIAHIPLVFWLGYQLNPRKSVHLFEHNRTGDKWDLLSSSQPFADLVTGQVSTAPDNYSRDVVIKFGISYLIKDADVNAVVPGAKHTIDLHSPAPALDSIRSLQQLESYAAAFRTVLDGIHNSEDPVDTVHVFYAGPVSLAFRCGQLISPTIHPAVLVYNYVSRDNPKYGWGIRVNSAIDSSDFLVQTSGG